MAFKEFKISSDLKEIEKWLDVKEMAMDDFRK